MCPACCLSPLGPLPRPLLLWTRNQRYLFSAPMRLFLGSAICSPRILTILCMPLFLKHFPGCEGGFVCFCTSRSSAGLWTLKEQKWLLFFWCPENLGPLQAHDRNWERAEWMTEWVHVTSRLAGSKNSLPKEYFNGFSSATGLTTPFSIPLIFHRLCNNLSPGLKRPITLVRLLLAGATPGSKGPLEPPLRSHTWTHAVGFHSDLFIAAYSFLLVCKMISMWFVDF